MSSVESVNAAAAVVSCTSLETITVLPHVLHGFFLRSTSWGSIHHHRLRLPLSVHYCVLPVIYSSQIPLEPQYNALHPLALLSLLRPRFILPLLHLSINTGIRGAAAGVSPLRQIPPCNWDCFLFMLRYRSTALLYVRAAGSRDQSAAVRF